MIVYKVVRRRNNGKLVSVISPPDLCVTYHPNQEALALNGAKLLAFCTQRQAEWFHNGFHLEPEEIWEAEAKNTKPIKKLVLWPLRLADVRAFWAETGKCPLLFKAPSGTVACDSITLIKRVDNGESE